MVSEMSHHRSPLIIPRIKGCVTRFGSFKHLQLLNAIKQGSNPIKTSIIHQKVPKKRQFEFLKYHLSVNWIQNLVSSIIDRNEILMEPHTITQSKGNYVLSDFIWGSIIFRQTKSCIQSFFPQLIIVCVFVTEMYLFIVWNSCPPVCSQWDGMKYLENLCWTGS